MNWLSTPFFLLACGILSSSCGPEPGTPQYYEKTMRLATEAVDHDALQLRKKVEWIYAQESMEGYRPVQRAIDSISMAYQAVRLDMAALGKDGLGGQVADTAIIQRFSGIGQRCDAAGKRAFEIYENLLRAKYGQLGLREEEVAARLERLKQDLLHEAGWLDWSGTRQGMGSPLYLLRMAELNMALEESAIEEDLANMLGCLRLASFMGMVPIVSPKQNRLKRGEVFRASIGLLTDELQVPPSDIWLSVDGVRQPFGSGRFVEYASEPIWVEKKTIRISCEVWDEFTQKSKPVFTDYPYEIRTE